MREYYQIPAAFRPKIFGMTASPIWNPKDPEGSLGTLEKNLDAIAISVKDHIAELLDNSPRPIEVRESNSLLYRTNLPVEDYQRISCTPRVLLLSPDPFTSMSVHVQFVGGLGISLGKDSPKISCHL
jgi:hypothetical protein